MIHIAHKTLQAIQAAIEVDQGARFRTLLRATMPLAEDAYRGEEDPFRAHLGASQIGADCARALWYEFHWTTPAKHSDRLLRLFNRGHLEEARFAAMLGAAGIKLYQYDKLNPHDVSVTVDNCKQFKIVMHGGHFGGSLDGVAAQIPEVSRPTLCEFKTHSRKSFAKLAGQNWLAHAADPGNCRFDGEGVRLAKFQHYVQMQMYMAAYQLSHGLYLAVCKDDDALYGEIIEADAAISGAFANRAREIIFAQEPPARIKNDPTWWQCKCCDKAPVCYGKKAPARNCRTCVHSRPIDGTFTTENPLNWACSFPRHTLTLSKQDQLLGCPNHEARKL